MVPADSRRVPRVPRYLGTTKRKNGIFIYAAVTLYGRPFQTVRLTLSYPPFHLPMSQSFRTGTPADDCGPATPSSPCGSPGLGSSDFARHYSRNHGCFLLLRVLRWFTSPGSPAYPMDSDMRDGCLHPPGFPIRISPDHSLLAAPRSFSQLTTSFFAYLRLGIHTHALSSLTIKSTSHTGTLLSRFLLVFSNARQIFCCQRSRLPLRQPANASRLPAADIHCLVGLGRIELPTSPLSGVRSSQLSYRPKSASGGAGRDRTGDLLNANQALSQLSYSPW
jgi:hypothetical protein